MMRKKEEEAVVLDFLPNGYPFDNRPMHLKTPIVQAIGKENYTLLELVPRKGIFLQPSEEVYIGEAKRDKIHHINGKIAVTRLTETAKSSLKHTIEALVKKHEANFIEFFNKAQPISTRTHVLELLPGVGKKHMWEIINERKAEPFKSFEDIRSRVKLMPDPATTIVKRIISELEGKEKHYLFVERPSDKNE
jgi:putative nucleotide binding protein